MIIIMNTPEQIDRNIKILDDIKARLSKMDAADILQIIDNTKESDEKLDSNFLIRFYCSRELRRRELIAISN